MALGIAMCMAVTSAVTVHPPLQPRAQESGQTTQGTVTETYSNERLDNGYTRISAGYTLAAYTGEPLLYKVGDMYKSGDASLTDEYGYAGNTDGGGALSIPAKGKAELEIDVPQSAVYYSQLSAASEQAAASSNEGLENSNVTVSQVDTGRGIFESIYELAKDLKKQ